MGVTGLWAVLEPCARPVKLETLNRKRLAVDASIWIYQFLKAVRDKEGNALKSSHVVGFFRRICKLLFFGIKPVFVFDGGAPALKRQTVASRKKRREGRREDAVRTAGKLLAMQMQRKAEEQVQARKDAMAAEQERQMQGGGSSAAGGRRAEVELEELPEDVVYVEELDMAPKERQAARQFKKKDQYHLPDLEVSLDKMGAPDDPRIMSAEDLEEYAKQFHTGEDVSLYDFSKIDFDSQFFQSLPAADRYNILNAARLRSRLRMGHSKEQLDDMFPDRMAFSRFQIERVAERNELTQRLMNLSGMNGPDAIFGGGMGGGTGRVAGERGREYVLVKNDGVEGGWALGVVGGAKDVGQRNKPIDLDPVKEEVDLEPDEDEDDDEFEDVPVEGLNRLPKFENLRTKSGNVTQNSTGKSRPVKRVTDPTPVEVVDEQAEEDDPNALFVTDSREAAQSQTDMIYEDVDADEEDMRRAIEMSLDDQLGLEPEAPPRKRVIDEESEDIRMAIEMSLIDKADATAKTMPTTTTTTALEDLSQISASKEKGKSKIVEPVAPTVMEALSTNQPIAKPAFPFAADDEDDEDGDMDMAKALSESRKAQTAANQPQTQTGESSSKSAPENPFGGPLPFERLDFSKSLLGKKKKPEVEAEKPAAAVNEDNAAPLPPWFAKEKLAVKPTTPTDANGLEANKATDAPPKQPGSPVVEKQPVTSYTVTEDGLVKPTQDLELDARQRSPSWASVNDEEESLVDVEMDTQDKAPTAQVEDIDFEKEYGIPEENQDQDEQDQYLDLEDEELYQAMAEEAEEHARFAAALNMKLPQAHDPQEYERQLKNLRVQQRKDRRDADEVSQVMITECQQLLSLFGLPYITAPMEAEAQCSELVRLGLVDGIVTDDSDAFLFGGTRVYKNMFNQAKFVECYLADDLEREYDLGRVKLIKLAHLLGSDYTEGIANVGPVGALEIVTEFSGEHGLEEFRDWISGLQEARGELANLTYSGIRKKLKRMSNKLYVPTNFPDLRVDEAYLKPEVDSDPTEFVWGVPDLASLRLFLMNTIGWSQERTDEVLVPVIKDMNQRNKEGTQANLTRFFSGSAGGVGAYEPRRRKGGGGKRMESALARLALQAKSRRKGADALDGVEMVIERISSGGEDEDGVEGSKKKRKKATKSKAATNGKSKKSGAAKRKKAARTDDLGTTSDEQDNAPEDEDEDEMYEMPARKSRRRGSS